MSTGMERQQVGDEMIAGAEVEPRRLLVISYHFPPDGSVGGLRWAGLSKNLVRLGWEVHVVTAAEQSAEGLAGGVHVHTCRRRRTLNDAYNDLAQRLRSGERSKSTAADAGTAPALPRPARVAEWIRRELSASLAFPDYARGWILRSARMARALLDRSEFHAVVTSGPPHSAHLAGLLATRGRPGLLQVDMRDPWADLLVKGWGKGLYRSALARVAIPRLERLVFHRASQVITNTAEFAVALRRSHPELAVAFLSNGIDSERLPPPATQRYEGLSIAYVGTLYAGRNLFPVIEALRRFVERNPEAREATRLRVAGNMPGDHAVRFRAQVEAAGISDIVEVLGVVPRADALDLLNRSHLALVLAQDQQMQIPAKLYECVGLHVPTLVIAEPMSAAGREARRIGAMALEPSDVDGIRGLIEDLWQGDIPTRIPPAAPIDYPRLAMEMNDLLPGTAAGDARPQPAGAGETHAARPAGTREAG